ncbi:SANT/Myb_domain [Hexamita inflata]|uniref:SANT/Myb domain n=1 Tax=Hexamita inflata TaxID=28002 RepID=A0AA86PKC2_9EUKA|nr:SANT/Myb domain [Hexamita inflata]CAI9944961.1 SANT/Myb domain [Hexamita inflata]
MSKNHRWTAEEDYLFYKLLRLYNNDFQVISEQLNKSYNQVRSHYYNIEKKLSKQNESIRNLIFQSSSDQNQQPYNLIVFDFV